MNLYDELIEQCKRRELNEYPHSLKFSLGERVYEEDIICRLYLDDEQQLVLHLFQSKLPSDFLYTSGDETVELLARTQGGSLIRIPNLRYQQLTSRVEGTVELIFYPDYIEVSSAMHYENGELYNQFVLKNGSFWGNVRSDAELISNFSYTVVDECPLHGLEEEKEAFSLKLSDADIVLRKTGNDYFEVAINPLSDDLDITALADTVLVTISLIEGRKLYWQILGVTNGNEEFFRLYSARPLGRALYPFVVSNNNSKVNTLLAETAMTFFHDSRNKDVITALEVAWFSRASGFIGMSLILSTAVESLVSFILNNRLPRIEKKAFEKDFNSLKEQSLSFLEGNALIGANQNFERLKNGIRGIHLLSQKKALYKAASLVNVFIHSKEVQAWEDTRHKLAHGDYLKPYVDKEGRPKKDAPSTAYIANLFNKLLLAVIGYRENYRDYGPRDSEQGRNPRVLRNYEELSNV